MAMTTEHAWFEQGASENATCPHCGTTKGEIARGKMVCVAHYDDRVRPRPRVVDDFDAIGARVDELRAERDAVRKE
jgi:hypothetical protein